MLHIFHHIPKTAGVSALNVFERWFSIIRDYRSDWNITGAGELVALDRLESNYLLAGHFELPETRLEVRYPEVWNQPKRYRVFTFLRSPLEVICSMYFYEMKHNRYAEKIDIDEYIRRRPTNYLALMLGCDEKNYRIILDRYWFIGITEDLQKSMDILAVMLGKPQLEIPTLNSTERDRSLTKEQQAEFWNKNQLDREIYRYAVDRLRKLRDAAPSVKTISNR